LPSRAAPRPSESLANRDQPEARRCCSRSSFVIANWIERPGPERRCTGGQLVLLARRWDFLEGDQHRSFQQLQVETTAGRNNSCPARRASFRRLIPEEFWGAAAAPAAAWAAGVRSQKKVIGWCKRRPDRISESSRAHSVSGRWLSVSRAATFGRTSSPRIRCQCDQWCSDRRRPCRGFRPRASKKFFSSLG